ncbi:MAG: ABC transporter permease subunit, partial [Nitrospirales bacterium]
LLDWAAGRLITFGGIAVILSILAIFVYLVKEVAPLFHAPTATPQYSYALPSSASEGEPEAIGVDEHQEIAFRINSQGVQFFDVQTGRPLAVQTPPMLKDLVVTAIAKDAGNSSRYALGSAEGLVIPIRVGVATTFSDSGDREKLAYASAEAPWPVASSSITHLAYRLSDETIGLVAVTDREEVLFAQTTRDEKEDHPVSTVTPLPVPPGKVTAVVMDQPLRNVYLGTADGQVHHISLNPSLGPMLIDSYRVPGDSPVSQLGLLLGDRTLVVMTRDGDLSTWIQVRNPGQLQHWLLRQNHQLATHPGAITAFAPSARDKGFLTGDAQGHVWLHHATSEQTLLRLRPTQRPIQALAMSPKADGIIAYDVGGTFTHYALHNPHPEVTFATLFSKVWYEGYDAPAHVWQSSSGADDFEPKFGMMPLAFGTLKGTIYALLFAIPIAILAAIYTSQFMHPDIRSKIKPTIEIMAALPTVVLGFLAGLWLAPLVEQYVPALVGMAVAVPLVILVAAWMWQRVPLACRTWMRPGMEALLLVPLLLAAIATCLWANPIFEYLLFAGDFHTWLSKYFGVRYDQRNALVVGLVMGFAVIPIIYTISEEALSNVPRHLIAGSLALGATRWETLVHLIFLTASPGIFSAVMIGFGRAIGETMIVLMATGNTPIMDWNWFNGFRTLSANIAVEIPEAPQGGTLYRILFLAALLLFLVTFAINTLAEIVRMQLRKRYSNL